jgi:hypothetical protein
LKPAHVLQWIIDVTQEEFHEWLQEFVLSSSCALRASCFEFFLAFLCAATSPCRLACLATTPLAGAGSWVKKGRTSFLKKRSKKLLGVGARASRNARAQV